MASLKLQSSSWIGVLCVAIYTNKKDLQYVRQVINEIDHLGKCKIHAAIISEKSSRPELYPINALRNIALEMASTDIVFLVDVDESCWGNLQEFYRDPKHYRYLLLFVSHQKFTLQGMYSQQSGLCDSCF